MNLLFLNIPIPKKRKRKTIWFVNIHFSWETRTKYLISNYLFSQIFNWFYKTELIKLL